MPGRTVVGCWSLRAGVMIVLGLLLVGGGYPVFANDENTTPIGIGVVVDGTPEEEGTPPGESDPDETEDLETIPPTPTPDSSGGGRDHEAVAPGTVTVVLWTSDQNPLPNRATVCVGSICQSGERMRSGTSFWFDEVEVGWHQVSVQVGPPYGSTTATVEVRDGTNGVVELTLVPVESAQIPVKGDKPSVPAVGTQPPASVAPQPALVQPAVDQSASASTSAVLALPATGSYPLPDSSPAPVLMLASLAILTATVAGGVLVTHRADRGA